MADEPYKPVFALPRGATAHSAAMLDEVEHGLEPGERLLWAGMPDRRRFVREIDRAILVVAAFMVGVGLLVGAVRLLAVGRQRRQPSRYSGNAGFTRQPSLYAVRAAPVLETMLRQGGPYDRLRWSGD